MSWLRIELEPADPDPERVEMELQRLGAMSVSFHDAGDAPVLEPGPGETPLWPRTRVSALFAESSDSSLLGERLEPLSIPGSLSVSRLEDQDWQRAWRNSVAPMCFGDRLWVLPAESDRAPSDAAILKLAPGLAFGTGTHPTTAMCLEWLTSMDLDGRCVLDFGCGSGVLGLAALTLGARSVLAVDTDPQALQATRENSRRNSLTDRISVLQPAEVPASARYDVVISNILSGALMELAPTLERLSDAHARVALSGILREQSADVSNAYAYWIDLKPAAVTDDWMLLTGRRSG